MLYEMKNNLFQSYYGFNNFTMDGILWRINWRGYASTRLYFNDRWWSDTTDRGYFQNCRLFTINLAKLGLSNAVKWCFKHSDRYDRLNHKPTVTLRVQVAKLSSTWFQISYWKTSYPQSSSIRFDTLELRRMIQYSSQARQYVFSTKLRICVM